MNLLPPKKSRITNRVIFQGSFVSKIATVMGLFILASSTSGRALNVSENPGLSDKSDGGAAVYTDASPQSGSLIPADLAKKYPVGQQARVFVLGGSVRGFGMLAAYDTPGDRSFIIARRTQKPVRSEPYIPIAVARVFDPKGNLVAVEEFTGQAEETTYRSIEIKNGMPGVWQVSFSGGRKDDLVEIRLSKTSAWGVRGEMALGVTDSTPRPAYLWIPPSSKKLLIGLESGSREGAEIKDASGNNSLVSHPEDDPIHRVGRLVLDPVPADSVCQIVFPDKFKGAFVIEGAPGLLCPDEKSARRLLGGTVENHGILVGGPLQARARDWMVSHAEKLELAPKYKFPSSVPKDIESPEIQVLAFSSSGPLNCLDWIVSEQNKNLDPTSPFFGGFGDPKPEDLGNPTWVNFLPTHPQSYRESTAPAAAAAFRSPLNPVYGNKEFIQRSAIAAFMHFASMQGDDLLREGNLFNTRYPMTHSFFVYESIAESYLALKDMLDPDAQCIWKQGLFAVGDKLADFQGYQSNQWAHTIRGHLDVFQATGEKRFLHYFERLMTAYLDDTFGPNSKFGQHPAGYYLEDCGPDGNYDKLNSYTVAACYFDYREIRGANPELVEKLRKSIEKNLRFSSFFWLLQPDGVIVSPNAINCRTTGMLGGAGFPGAFMPKSEFPLAASRFALCPVPTSGLGDAGIFSYIANTDAWIRQTLEDGVAKGPGRVHGIGGGWALSLAKAYSQPKKVEAAPLPIDEDGGNWSLPGLIAWNRGGLYGVVFYDVVGADHVLKGITGGGPTALWTRSTGTFLSSTHPGKPQESMEITDQKALTFSCVYGMDGDGKLFYSGKQRAEVKVLEEGKHYEIDSTLSSPLASLIWDYVIGAESLKISVQLKASSPFKEQYVNLPLLKRLGDTRISLSGKNTLVFETAKGAVRLDWPEAYPGELQPSVSAEIQRLVIPLPRDGTPLVIRIQSGIATPPAPR